LDFALFLRFTADFFGFMGLAFASNPTSLSKFSNSEPFGSGIAICVRGRITPPFRKS